MDPSPPSSPLVTLRPYQQQVFFQRLLGVLFFIWRRQCGKSFVLGNIGLDWMMETAGITVTFISAALRLGQENLRKEAEVWRQIMTLMRRAANASGQYQLDAGLADDDAGNLLDVEAIADLLEHNKLEVKLYHDNVTFSRSIVIAPNPDTAVGWTGHLILDEVGRMPNFREMWEAAMPFIASNPHLKIRGATTPPPDDTHFSYELLAPTTDAFPVSATGNYYRSESGLMVHRVDAYDAQAAGIPLYDLETRQPITPEADRAKSLDRTGWDRNFGCQFIKGGSAAISREDLAHAREFGRNEGQGVKITDQLVLG